MTPELTALHVGSGSVPVFATPMMVALVEKACSQSIKPYLEDGFGSVGTIVNIAHTAASPIGAKVCCESELVEIDNRRLIFKAVVRDGAGIVGEGTHERFIINEERFIAKAAARKG